MPDLRESQLRVILLVMIGAVNISGGLMAQVAGLPVRNAGVGTGLSIAADVGFPNADAGRGLALGITAAFGVGPLGIAGSVATWNPDGTQESINSIGFTGNVTVFGGRRPVSITLQGGAGYDNVGGSNNWHIPLGIGLALTIRKRTFFVKPWVAPRVSITGDSPDESQSGISGGLDLGFLSRLTVRAMYDRVGARGGLTPSVLSLGLGLKVGK